MPKPTLRLLVTRLPVDPDVDGPGAELPMAARVGLIAVGGAVGAVLRAVIESAQPSGATFPWATLAINLCGSALLALLLVVLEEAFPSVRVVRPLVGTGVLGGFTTFSTFAVETDELLLHGDAGLAAGYVAASCIGALVMALLGLVVGRAASRLANRERWLRQVRHAASIELAEEFQ